MDVCGGVVLYLEAALGRILDSSPGLEQQVTLRPLICVTQKADKGLGQSVVCIAPLQAAIPPVLSS